MSGYYARLPYDACASAQYTEESTRKNRLWDFLNAKFENRPSNNPLAKCGGKNAHIECSKASCRRTYSEKVPSIAKCGECHCDDDHRMPAKDCQWNNSADLDNTRKANLSYRIDTENDLLGLTRPLSNCDSKKFLPCWAENLGEYGNFVRKPRTCDKHKSIAQPLLCDRAITPTNVHKYAGWASYCGPANTDASATRM